MKCKKKYIATLLGLGITAASYAQKDLIHQVPENASFVFVINNEAIVKHGSVEKINEVLNQLGVFDNIENPAVQIQSAQDLDIAYDRNAYIYKTDTDSSYYTGILLPLKTGHQIGTHLFSELSALSIAQGYERRISTDGKTQVAWDEHSVFILTGDARPYYFDSDSVAQRYDMELPDYSYDIPPAYEYNYDDDYDYDYTYPDSIYNPDSSYQKEMARQAKNDSLRNAAFASWLARDFDDYLRPAQRAASYKQLYKFDKKNTLVHFWARDLMSIYRQTLPYSVMNMTMPLAYGYNMENIIYAYQDIVFDLVQDKHTLKLKGSIGLQENMARMISPIYKNKMNRKFKRFIPEDHMGYLSLNISTETYLKNFPQLLGQVYGGSMYFAFGEVADIISTALQIALDEKAIANVIGGDHVLFINEMKKVQKEYIDYEYDVDNFDYKEIKKTKDDYIPTFLWMFTSKDQRIYQKILGLGEYKGRVTQTDGIYKITDNPSKEIIYALFKDDIVFVSNDEDQLSAIRTNQFRASKDKQIRKQIYANSMTAVTHLSEIPETINRLGIPIITTWDRVMNNLSAYGDATITAKGTKKGKITGEIAVDFPEQGDNALQYLLQELLDTID